MLGYKKKLGAWGEELAGKYYIEHGYIPIDSNWQKRQGEIDLIFEKDKEVIFVEVKTRTTPAFGGGEEAVDARKKHKMRLVINKYLNENKKYQKYFPRVDVMVVEIFSLTPKFIHYENITL